MFTIVDLIAEAENEDRIEELLDILIEDAIFEDVYNIKTALNDKLLWETVIKAKNNYVKALELL